MKIAIFCQQLEYMGGIERVVLEHLRIFGEHGAEIVLLIDRKPVLMASALNVPVCVLPDDASARKSELTRVMSTEHYDVLILHGVSHRHATDDVAVAKEFGTPSVCVVHFPFVSNIALGGGEYNSWRRFMENGRDCTAFATVSRIDAMFWRGLGKRAFHVQNPFVHPPERVEGGECGSEDGVVNLLWVGRLCEQKQPELALAAFALAARECPNVRLTMIGGDAAGIKALARVTKRLGVADKVEFVVERSNIGEYWGKAHIHLLTSVCESFCLVWAEAKAAGIPTVMFELPYLELAEDRRGYVAVEQQNLEAFAAAVVDLVKNEAKRKRMGVEARESLVGFNDDAVWKSWQRVFDALKMPTGELDVDSDLSMIVRQLYFAVDHDKSVHRWPEEMAFDWQKLMRFSMRPFANTLHRTVAAVKWCKAKIRG